MSAYVRVLSMRKASAATFVLLILAAFAHGQTAASYVGYEYKGAVPDTVMPNGVKHLEEFEEMLHAVARSGVVLTPASSVCGRPYPRSRA